MLILTISTALGAAFAAVSAAFAAFGAHEAATESRHAPFEASVPTTALLRRRLLLILHLTLRRVVPLWGRLTIRLQPITELVFAV